VTFRLLQSAALMCGCALLPHQLSSAPIDSFFQSNLTSDLPGVAANMDANLVNPWGIAFSGTSPYLDFGQRHRPGNYLQRC
jgi:hypothetical protein